MPKSTTSERWGAGSAFASVGTGKHRGAHRGNHDGGAWTAVLVRWRQLHDSLPSSHRRPVRRRDGLAPHGKAPGARWIDDRYRRTLSRGHGSQRPRHRRFSRGSAPMTRTTTKSWLLTLWIALPLAACAAPRRAALRCPLARAGRTGRSLAAEGAAYSPEHLAPDRYHAISEGEQERCGRMFGGGGGRGRPGRTERGWR